MQTKYLCVLIHIWIKGEGYFTDRSNAVLLLWISVLRLLCLYVRPFICALWSPAGKGLTSWLSFVVSNCEFVTCSRLWCLTVSLSLSHRYPGSGVVLDCIDSWSLHPFLLCLEIITCDPSIYMMTMLTLFNVALWKIPLVWKRLIFFNCCFSLWT